MAEVAACLSFFTAALVCQDGSSLGHLYPWLLFGSVSGSMLGSVHIYIIGLLIVVLLKRELHSMQCLDRLENGSDLLLWLCYEQKP